MRNASPQGAGIERGRLQETRATGMRPLGADHPTESGILADDLMVEEGPNNDHEPLTGSATTVRDDAVAGAAIREGSAKSRPSER